MAHNRRVAVIGAGIAGLAAARVLSREGVNVRVFEANGNVGGCCATTRMDGYTFNDGALYLAMPGMLERLFETLGLERKRLLPLKKISFIQSTLLPDSSIVDICSGPEVTVFHAEGKSDSALLQQELREFLKTWDPTLSFFEEEIMVRPLSFPYLLARGWGHLAKLRGTAASHLKSSFSSEAVRAAFGGVLLYSGVSPDRMPASLLLPLVSMLRDGFYLPEGGMGRITECLSDAVQRDGGEIVCQSAVRRILARRGRVYGVEVEHEGVVEADAVVSTVSAMHTYSSLLSVSEVPVRMKRDVQRASLSHRGFSLQLGLANKIESRCHINSELPWFDDQSQLFQSNGKKSAWLTYMVPTQTLPELAPAGCSIVEMFPSINQQLQAEEWSEAAKQDVATNAIEQLRRKYEINIAVSRIRSPREFRNDLHLYGGALYGLLPTVSPAALFQHRTPIHGLWQAGQTTWPGFGVVGSGWSGVFAARAMIHGERF